MHHIFTDHNIFICKVTVKLGMKFRAVSLTAFGNADIPAWHSAFSFVGRESDVFSKNKLVFELFLTKNLALFLSSIALFPVFMN